MEQSTSESRATDHESPVTSFLALDAPERVVRISFAGKTARHFFRRLGITDWLLYLKELRSEFLSDAEKWIPENRWTEAAIALWDGAIVRVEGYKGLAAVSAPEEKATMPALHKKAAVTLLQQVVALPGADPFDLEADSRTVRLEAAWNETIYQNLIHRFRPPSQADALAYDRLKVEYYRSRGRRDGATRIVIPPRLKQLCEIYDRLCLDVSGYSGMQTPSEMDPLHKQAAVQGLFEPVESESGEVGSTTSDV